MPKSRKDVTSNERFAKIVKALSGHPGVTPPSDTTQSRKKFGSSGLKINDKIFAMISSKAELVVKLREQRVDGLVTCGKGKRFDPGHGRPRKDWLTGETTSENGWRQLAKQWMECVAGRTQ